MKHVPPSLFISGIILGLLPLSGCSVLQSYQINKGMELAQTDKEQCLRQFPHNKENAVKLVQCTNESLLHRMSDAGYPYMPALMQYTAARSKLAVQFSEGKLTPAEMGAEEDVLWANFLSAEQGNVQQDNAARAAAWQRASSFMQQQQMINNANRPTTTNCMGTGSMVNCTTY